MKMVVATIGNPDKSIMHLIDKYQKRIKHFTKFELVALKESSLIKKIQKYKENGFKIIFLEEAGKQFNSFGFARYIESFLNNSEDILFVIGPAHGFTEKDKILANYFLSLSKFTMQHDIALLVLLEQIYRSYTIINNQNYHK